MKEIDLSSLNVGAFKLSGTIIIDNHTEDVIAATLECNNYRKPGKHIDSLPKALLLFDGSNIIGGLLVSDVRSPLTKKSEINRSKRLEKPNIQSEAHALDADLWYLVDDEMLFITGGKLTNQRHKLKKDDSTEDPNELIGDAIKGGHQRLLTPKKPGLYIPPTIPHQHGTKDESSTAMAIAFKIRSSV